MAPGDFFDLRRGMGVQLGSGNVQHNYLPQRAPVDWPLRVGVPPTPARAAVPRPVDRALDEATGCLVLSGMSGVGKTHAAAALADRLWSRGRIDLLLWADAASRESIVTAYAGAADELRLADVGTTERDADRFLGWLAAPRDGRRWLVVLDGLTDPGDLRGLLPPSTGLGRVLVTTQRTDGVLRAQIGTVATLGPYTPEESGAYLRQALAAHTWLHDDPGLAADLGHLPSALARAVAYMVEENIGCRAFRDSLRAGARLEGLDVTGGLDLSIRAADRLEPAGGAGNLLRLASLLDGQGVPMELLATAPVRAHIGGDPARALANLSRFGLASRRDGLMLTPAIVQRAVHDALPAEDLATLAHVCADGLVELWKSAPALAPRLRENTARLCAATGDALLTGEVHDAVLASAESLFGEERFGAARDELTALSRDIARVFGERSEEAARIRFLLAITHGVAGDPYGGWRDAEDAARILAPSDLEAEPDVIMLKAMLRSFAGDPGGAAAQLDAVIARRKDVRDPEWFTPRLLAAWSHQLAGRPAHAARLLAQLHATALWHFGADGTDTLDVREYIADGRALLGDAAGALPDAVLLIADRARVQGPEHMNVVRARIRHARLRGEAGHPGEAAEALIPLIAGMTDRLGAGHIDIVEARIVHARLLRAAGRHEDAMAALVRLLADTKSFLVPYHPAVFEARRDLARARGEFGAPETAAKALSRLLADMRPYLPPAAPLVLTTRMELARFRERSGDRSGALAAYRALLPLLRQAWDHAYPPLRAAEHRHAVLLAALS